MSTVKYGIMIWYDTVKVHAMQTYEGVQEQLYAFLTSHYMRGWGGEW
jgi:hypothetical protein